MFQKSFNFVCPQSMTQIRRTCVCLRFNETKAPESTFNLQVIKKEHLIPGMICFFFYRFFAFCAFLLRLLIVCFNSSFTGAVLYIYFFTLAHTSIAITKSHFYLFIASHHQNWNEKYTSKCRLFAWNFIENWFLTLLAEVFRLWEKRKMFHISNKQKRSIEPFQ